MKAIIPPINRDNLGAEVTNLQDGLLLLLRREVIQVSDEAQRILEERLPMEQRERVYGDYTLEAVNAFQKQFRLL